MALTTSIVEIAKDEGDHGAPEIVAHRFARNLESVRLALGLRIGSKGCGGRRCAIRTPARVGPHLLLRTRIRRCPQPGRSIQTDRHSGSRAGEHPGRARRECFTARAPRGQAHFLSAEGRSLSAQSDPRGFRGSRAPDAGSLFGLCRRRVARGRLSASDRARCDRHCRRASRGVRAVGQRQRPAQRRPGPAGGRLVGDATRSVGGPVDAQRARRRAAAGDPLRRGLHGGSTTVRGLRQQADRRRRALHLQAAAGIDQSGQSESAAHVQRPAARHHGRLE